MDGINRVTLFGSLGAEPELRYTQGNGTAVMNLRLATNERYLDKKENEWKDRTEWHSVVVWGKRAEGLAKFLAKGSTLLIEGALRTSSYTDRDGNKRYKTEVVASNVIPAGGGRGRSESTRQVEPSQGPPKDLDDELPNYGGPEDDIPF